jgi:hypothetical protein
MIERALLNLSRKKYDSIKYDLQKIEEVIYDVKLRNLGAAAVVVAVPAASVVSPAP